MYTTYYSGTICPACKQAPLTVYFTTYGTGDPETGEYWGEELCLDDVECPNGCELYIEDYPELENTAEQWETECFSDACQVVKIQESRLMVITDGYYADEIRKENGLWFWLRKSTTSYLVVSWGVGGMSA